MEQFKSFIKEEMEDSYRVVVISTNAEGKGITNQRIEEEAKKLDYPYYSSSMSDTYTLFNDGQRTIHKGDDDKGFKIHPKDTVIFVRGTPQRDSSLDLITQLQRAGYCVVNSRNCIETAADKYRTYLRLQDFGLTQPKTVLVPDTDSVEKAFTKLDTKFPIILKTLRGSKGVGVLFVESEIALNSIVQLLYKQDSEMDILIQEYIKTDFDVRVLVLGGKVIATMQRDVVEGDFRSNVSQGAKVKKYNLTKLETEHSIRAAKSVGGIFTAVDFIPSNDPENKPPHILEVNSSPGTEGIEEANNSNIVSDVLKYFNNTKIRYTVPTECGYEEVITINPFGEMVAKFDTGNSSMCVLHAEDIEVSGKKVTFTTKDKTITTNFVGEYKASSGIGDDVRPVVELEFEYAGTNFGRVRFGLDNREDMSTDVLLNRDVMKTINVMVNPQRKYLITTPFTLDN